MAIFDEIMNFLIEQEMAPARFGTLAMSDPSLIRDIKGGRELRGPAEECIRMFMREFRCGAIKNIMPEKAPKREPRLIELPEEEPASFGAEISHRAMMKRGNALLLEAVLNELSMIARRNRATA